MTRCLMVRSASLLRSSPPSFTSVSEGSRPPLLSTRMRASGCSMISLSVQWRNGAGESSMVSSGASSILEVLSVVPSGVMTASSPFWSAMNSRV